jgi:threonine synthase
LNSRETRDETLQHMFYYSTNDRSYRVTLRAAVLQGLAPDGGLYMPEEILPLPEHFFLSMGQRSFREIGLEVSRHILGEDVPEAETLKIVEETLQFDAPLVEVEKNIFSLELFHGPTLAFKDFGARFLSGLLGYFAREQKKEIVILAATSGDTGSAVANGFLNVAGTRVVVLYPSGKVSNLQEKQFTTLGGNVTALEIAGTFDDCQHLVKQAFRDKLLKQRLVLASANSINIARLIPQTFYYFNAWARLQHTDRPVVFSVPSGNFGNLTAGLIAKRLGLPVRKFVAATNINDIVPAYLKSGLYSPRRSTETISNAMDVGTPSNFARLLDLYHDHPEVLMQDVAGYSFTDQETKVAMKELFLKGYMADPHGAVGYLGLKHYLADYHENVTGVFLETAHPGKFKDVVEQTLDQAPELPDRLKAFMNAKKVSIKMGNDFDEFKDWLFEF